MQKHTITIYDGKMLAVKDFMELTHWEIAYDRDYKGNSFVEFTADQNIVESGDFVDIRQGKFAFFTGFVPSVEDAGEGRRVLLSIAEVPMRFDRNVFIRDAAILRNRGIEDFIVQLITENFIASGDPVLDMPFIELAAFSHTPVEAFPESEANNTVNLLEYLASARALYNIQVESRIVGDKLRIDIGRIEAPPILIDAMLKDVQFTEILGDDNTSRVEVSLQSVDNQTGVITRQYTRFYALDDGTITTDANAPGRIRGRSEITVVSNEEEIEQAALDAFSRNSFQHHMELKMPLQSDLWDVPALRVGHPVRIRTRLSGMRETTVARRYERMGSGFVEIECGNLRTTLTDILRGDSSVRS